MNQRPSQGLIIDDLNTERDEIGTLLHRPDDRKVSSLPFFTDSAWVCPKPGEIVMEASSHTHDFHEIVPLFKTDPDDPRNLCAEVEFWLDGKRHLLIKGCLIYVPKGIEHCPLIFRNVTRPIFHYVVGDAGRYSA